MGLWLLQTQVVYKPEHDFPPTEWALCPIRQLLVVHKIKKPLFHHCGYLVSLVTVQLGRTTSCSSTLAAYIETFETIKTTPLGRGFQVGSSLIPPSPVYKMHHAFRNSVVPSNSGRQLKAMVIAHIALRDGLLDSPD